MIETVLLVVVTVAPATAIEAGLDLPPPCESRVYCVGGPGTLLHTVQMARVFPDSKTFVDMPMRFDEQQVLDNFEQFISVRVPPHTKW